MRKSSFWNLNSRKNGTLLFISETIIFLKIFKNYGIWSFTEPTKQYHSNEKVAAFNEKIAAIPSVWKRRTRVENILYPNPYYIYGTEYDRWDLS